eukprot:UN04268
MQGLHLYQREKNSGDGLSTQMSNQIMVIPLGFQIIGIFIFKISSKKF